MKSNNRLHQIIHIMSLIIGFVLCANANAELLPDLTISTIDAPAQATGGTRVSVNVTVVNQGTATAAPAPVGVYYSYNTTVDQDDPLLGSVMLPALAAGQSTTVTLEGVLPVNEYIIYNFYIGAYVDYPGTVAEADDGNNAMVTAVEISGNTCGVDGFENNDAMAQAREIYLGDRQLHNFCDDATDWLVFEAVGGNIYHIHGGDSDVGDNPAVVMELYDAAGNRLLSSGIQLYPKLSFVAPATGRYFIKQNSYMGKTGLDKQYLVALFDASLDLIINYIDFYATSNLPGGILELTETVNNISINDSPASEVGYYLSTDKHVSNADILLGTRSVDALASYTYSQARPSSIVSLPLDLAPGTYYFAAIADHDNQVAEYRETNNNSYAYTESGAFPIEVVAALCTGDTYENDDSPGAATAMVPGDAQIHNHCDDNADWVAFNAVTGASYIVETSSIDQKAASVLELFDIDGRTRLVQQRADTASTGDDHTARIVWQAPADGVYYVKVSNSSYTHVGQNTEYTIELLAKQALPDLKVHSTSSGPYEVSAGAASGLWLEIYNQGYADAPASEVGVYLSSDWNVTRDDLLLRQRSVNPLAAGSGQRDIQPRFSFPASLAPGTYYIAALSDSTDQVLELSELNNGMRPLVVNVSAPPCPADSYEEDDAWYMAHPMAMGVAEQHNHCEDSIDIFTLNVDVGATYVFDTTNLGVNQDTMMWLYNADGSFAGFDDSSGVDPRAARLETYLFPGQYYLQVQGNRGVDTEYTFTATRPGKVRGKGKNK